MNDKEFTGTLNTLSRELGLVMPTLQEDEAPPDGFLADWAHFLESAVKRGVKVSDPRWQRLTVVSNAPCVRFDIQGVNKRPDSDFRIGLQLLVGMLDPEDETA
jgi:hypothetical protein